jgi:hypothetical protein
MDCWAGAEGCECEVLRESGGEEGSYEGEDFMACLFGAREALEDLGAVRAEEAAAEEVLREVGGVEGEPIGFVEALEAHGHFGGCAFAERGEMVRLDILGELDFRVGNGLSGCVECAVEECLFPEDAERLT